MTDEPTPRASNAAPPRNAGAAPSTEAALDRALAALPRSDVDPLWARSTRIAAERRLTAGSPALSRTARLEPWLLMSLSALQLLWAALRVFALAR